LDYQDHLHCYLFLFKPFFLPNDLKNIPLKTKIAASKEPTIALSTGIDVNRDIKMNEIAAAARLRGNQILIAADKLINLILIILIYYPNLWLTARTCKTTLLLNIRQFERLNYLGFGELSSKF
jgi:hypothetical protein